MYGCPKDQALKVAVDTIGDFLLAHDMTVYLVIFDRAAYTIGGKLFADIAAYIDDHYVDAHTDSRETQRRRMAMASMPMEESECMPAPVPWHPPVWTRPSANWMKVFLRCCCGRSTNVA